METTYKSPLKEFRGKVFSPKELDVKPMQCIDLGGVAVKPSNPPKGLVHRQELGILIHESMDIQQIHAWPKPYGFSEPQRAVMTPSGDYLMMACVGKGHQWGNIDKVNEIVSYRSKDKGRTWIGPEQPWEVPYSQHAFNPLIPKGSKRIYSFGTDFVPEHVILPHNGLIPVRYSDDDGYTWSQPNFIRPVNDPEYRGVGHMQGCETDKGTWLLGTYFIDKKEDQPRKDKQYILRSEDQGNTWRLLPDKRHGGWGIEGYGSIMEGQVINVGDGEILFMIRTLEGHLWESRSWDDGKTWSDFKATSLVHPYSPPMIFKLMDQKTLIAFIHNRTKQASDQINYPDPFERSELWICLSKDKGKTWSEPRFMLANTDEGAAGYGMVTGYEVDYGDLIVDGTDLHFFYDHRKRQVHHVHFREEDIMKLPTKKELSY